MELSERKLKILLTIIELYSKKGEAVSSKVLSDIFGSYSSATIRNEMASLEVLGLLNQPHTSSGRVPTYLGYRVYIDNILKTGDLKKTEKHSINTLMTVTDFKPDYFLQIASNVLAQKTNYTSIVTLPSNGSVKIKGLEFIMINQKTVVATIVFSTTHVKNKVCRLDFAITSDVLEKFCNIVNSTITKIALSEMTPDIMEQIILTMGTYGLLLNPLVKAIVDMCTDIDVDNVIIGGRNNLFKFKDFESNIDNIFNILSNNTTIYKLLDTSIDDTRVMIGDEIGIDSISGSSIITAKYTFADGYKGSVSVIGPMRMDYGKVIPHIKYIADVVGKTFDDTIKED
ncbi:MAG: heat-inducible transcriptional repressor HrcA [Oscillospiraceae bacterium]